MSKSQLLLESIEEEVLKFLQNLIKGTEWDNKVFLAGSAGKSGNWVRFLAPFTLIDLPVDGCVLPSKWVYTSNNTLFDVPFKTSLK